MAPSGRTITTSQPTKPKTKETTRTRTRRIRRTTTTTTTTTTKLKKQQKRVNKKRKEEEEEEEVGVMISQELRKDIDDDDEVIDDVVGGSCSTPKGQKFRIPEISTCPPAPKKQRVISSSSNCSLRRSPLSFFSPPDLDLFFFMALSRTDVSV